MSQKQKKINKVLVANRGEIACRILNTLKEMGLASVAIFSEADKDALHRQWADQAFCVGKASPRESYLDQDAILQCAQKSGANAIHPGYGFLSENAEFARKVTKAGMIFIGPTKESIELMGDKVASRQHAHSLGVPVIPGTSSITESNIIQIKNQLEGIGYPVLLKASGGGGGKGMRVVQRESDLEQNCAAARREALAAFGDDTIYAEKWISSPRHIEIQILGDGQGNAIHLNERECSIQRRHQKVVEETPSLALTPEIRQQMGEVAVKIASSIQYAGAGTMEFILDGKGQFFFLEMNTRLQVEHAVTEMVTGIDLVREQVDIASGNGLKFSQDEIVSRGHAIECRIYAEDPAHHFFPQAGVIHLLREPKFPGVRHDCGFQSGDKVGTEYDPMISKLIVHACDRPTAIQKMRCALTDLIILGITTNRQFCLDLISHPAFAKGEIDTAFIERHFSHWKPTQKYRELAGILSEKLKTEPNHTENASKQYSSPWESLRKWRMGESTVETRS
jgi:acetyl-CoA carboxylase biotin carboxylase subunit